MVLNNTIIYINCRYFGKLKKLAKDLWAFSGELVWFAPLLGEGKES
jgi:hypothetical protein